MGPQSSAFLWLSLMAVVVATLPAAVSPGSRKKASSSKKTTYYYYHPGTQRGQWYHHWPDTLTRRSFGSWEDSYDEWLPWKGYKYTLAPVLPKLSTKTLLAHKHHHLYHGHGRSGCGLEAVLVGILLIVPLMVLIGLMLPVVLIIISVMVGVPLLVPAPAFLPPLAQNAAEAAQGRRRRDVFGEPLEEVLVTTLQKLLVAVAKYGDL
ncbi:uncharacterized protein LOC144167039 [Haemaphysalis longicornis]